MVDVLVGIIDHSDAVGEVYNVGHTQEVSILQLAQRVKRLTDSDSEIVFVPYERAYGQGFEDMARRVPDISKVKKLLGYSPTIALDETLQSIIDFQRSSATPPGSMYRTALGDSRTVA